MTKIPVTVLIMTQNEAVNIRHALESVIADFDQVIVADSFSSDGTLDIIREFPAVEFYQHRFEGWAEQRNWMLDNCGIKNSKVIFLDADEYLTPAFIAELRGLLGSGREFSSVKVRPELVFMGKVLRFAYGHPKIGRLFSRAVRFAGAGAREYAIVSGPQLEISSPLMHRDRKPLSALWGKHLANAEREAAEYEGLGRREPVPEKSVDEDALSRMDLRRNIWDRLPLILRPLCYFGYRYVFKLGFLDGLPGFVYCFMQAFAYQMMIDVKILRRKAF
ncbi:MAG TPA: glycosyltransferase family 2 protein [Elusimicrobiales bacterium]|nr:glycosyltransferase family 2 protein [Elusimicrobiales bacterium]